MKITNLELVNFRNYHKCKFTNFSDTNVIIGTNGVGKTTILEAIYFGSLTKTFKSNSDLVLINSDSIHTKIKLSVQDKKSLNSKKLEIHLTSKGKKTKVNGILKKKLSDYIFKYRVIVLSPDEIKIIKDSPHVRRNYLNIQISQLEKQYIKKLNDYNILIKNKNDYLKKLFLNKNLDLKYLDVIDEKIADLGLDISFSRKQYVEGINKYINKKFKKFLPNDDVFLEYVSDFNNLNLNSCIKLLRKQRVKEINIGMTSTGIHRDDIVFLHNNKNAKEYSSQGLQKLIMISMKFAELEIFIKKYNITPILLLDDLFSELDILNQNNLLQFLSKKYQIFITTTDLNNINLKLTKNLKIFELKENTEIYE